MPRTHLSNATLSGSLGRAAGTLARSKQGGTTMLFALLAIPVIGMVGFSVDMVRSSNAKSALRAALDASLLSAAQEGTSSFQTTANAYFGSNVNQLAKLDPIANFSFAETSRGACGGCMPRSRVAPSPSQLWA